MTKREPIPISERRRYPRVEEYLRIEVAKGHEQIVTKTVNLSCGGTLCWLEHPLPLMTKVVVSLALPTRLVHCRGVVVRCESVRAAAERLRGQYRVALFFTELARRDHRAIAEFVLESMFAPAHGYRRP